MGERILLLFFVEAIQIGGEFVIRDSRFILNFLGKFGEGANGTFVGTDEALSSWTAEKRKAQHDDGDDRDGGQQGCAGVSAHGLTPEGAEPAAADPTKSALRSEPK